MGRGVWGGVCGDFYVLGGLHMCIYICVVYMYTYVHLGEAAPYSTLDTFSTSHAPHTPPLTHIIPTNNFPHSPTPPRTVLICRLRLLGICASLGHWVGCWVQVQVSRLSRYTMGSSEYLRVVCWGVGVLEEYLHEELGCWETHMGAVMRVQV